MVVGLVIVGSFAGFVSAIVAMVSGVSLLGAIGVYAGASMASVAGLIALCAIRTGLAELRLRNGAQKPALEPSMGA